MPNPEVEQAVTHAAALAPAKAGRDLATLPKAEMHLHLIGAMRPTTLVDLSTRAGRTAPDPRVFTTFAQFERIYQAAFAALESRMANLLRVVREIVADAATDGVVWVQPQFDPHSFHRFAPAAEVLEQVLATGRDAGARHGVGFGVTVAAMRHRGPEAAEDLARFAARWAGHGVHAFGLNGDEATFATEPFARAFAIARDAGLATAPHAGELAGPDSVRAAVDLLGATRIAHGIRAIEDPRLVNDLARRSVTLDVCLTSNTALGVVPDLTRHPLPRLLAAGVPCTLGADDPLLFGVGLLDEYQLARTALGLTDQHLADLARTSIQTTTAPAPLITTALAGIDDWLNTTAADLPERTAPPT